MKTVRIYRARKDNQNQSVNTYLQYFDTMKEAQAAPKLDKWECRKIRYEKFDSETQKWNSLAI